MDRFTRHKIKKDIETLKGTLGKMDLIDINKTIHPKEAEYTFFSAHASFSKIDHMLGHKTNLNKFKKIIIISSIFSDHYSMKLEINLNKKTQNIQIFGAK